ncbi:MAG: rod shape-determining protein MreD [Gammaproteobacteria bacterium]|jgi:rod shape-determining protein MreD
MILARHQGGGVILLSFIAALLLTIIPLPEWARYGRPDWVCLVLIYWCMAVPERVGVITGWFMGLLLDLLSGTLLGQHALSLTIVAGLTLKLHQRIRLFPVWQQALTVLILLVLNQLLALWVSRIIGRPGVGWYYWAPSLTGMLIWPPIYYVLRQLRLAFKVR